jgi:competence ComEA-like helix-hairpin-helix protein
MRHLSIAIALILLSICPRILAVEKIDINTAPLDDLTKIVHIGEKRGLELIPLRPFSSLDDLTRIKGVGAVRVEDIKEQGLAYVGIKPEERTELPEATSPTTKGEIEEVAPSATEPESLSKAGANNSLKVDVNSASTEDLQSLTGVSSVIAQRIIDLRPFYAIEDLAKVNGIGTETLKDIKDQGLAWVDLSMIRPKTEERELPDKNPETASVLSRQIESTFPSPPFSVFLTAFVLAAFSGIIILFLKINLKKVS